ncbi:hypothetical protein Chor_013203 [Crotalus horridus]
MDGAKRRSIIRRVWPQLVDFLSHHSEWLLKKAEMLLSQDDLSFVGRVPDLERKRLLILDMVLRDVDANPEVFRKFTQSVYAAERYCQHILSLMFRKFGIDRSAETAETKDEPLAFSQKFVNLVMHHSRASKLKVGSKKIKEEPVSPHEFKDHGNPMENLSELFKSVQMGITQVVLLLGKAGMGKTCFVHQICQQWAEGALPQFKLIFFFEFKQLNLIAKRKLTLQELLFEYFLQPDQPDTVFQFLLENAQQTLVILDGLDEFVENIPLPPIPFTSFSDLLMPCSVSELVANLCHGELLAGCTVLITSRLNLLPAELVKGTVALAEVWGFHRDNVEEYVSYFFQEPFQKEQALTLLNDNGKLLSMCYIPAMCHIICTCLKHLFLEDAENVQLPQTRTQFYTTMLQIFICKHQGGRTLNEIDMGQYQATLTDLCELAFRGLEENKRVFDAGEVPEHVKDFFCHFGLLLASEVKMGKDPVQMAYTFAHFSFQEFFAALFLLASPTVDCKILKENFSLRSKWILKKETRMSFTENYHIFLSGLSSQGCRPFLCCLAGRNEVWIQERQNIITEILQKLAVANLTGPRIVELCHCVYETQDISLAQHIAKELAFKYQFRNVGLMPFDMVTLAFLINGSPHGVCLDFVGCPLELDYLDIWGSCENIKSLRLTGGNLRSPGFEDLIRVFPNCHQLEEINLSHNKMSVGTVLAFSRAVAKCPKVSSLEIRLKDVGINEEEIAPKPRSLILQLQDCQLDSRAAEELVDILQNCSRLSKINLSNNRLSLKSIFCLLDTANLCPNVVMLEARNYHFHDAQLNKCQQMEMASKKICLSSNSLGDSGMLKIMDSIRDLKNLNSLILDNNQMSLDGVFSLLEVFSILQHINSVQLGLEGCTTGLDMTRLFRILTKCSGLAEINVRDNAFSTNGICFLANSFNWCSRLSEVNLRFVNCDIDRADLRALGAVFENCDHLAELDLSGNNLDNEALRCLFGHLPKTQNSCLLKINRNRISQDGILLLVNFLATMDDVVEVHASLCPEKMLLITFRKQAKPQKILNLKECDFQAEHLAQLLSRLEECPALSDFTSINNGLTLSSAKTLLRALKRAAGVQKISIEEPWVADESFLALLSLAAEVQGEVIAIMTSHLLFPDAEGPTSFDALVHFPALQKLWLTNGRILPASVEHVAEILQRGLFIEDINFSNSDLSSDGLSVLLDALAGKLKSINLGSLNLDNTTILKLSSKLSTMPFLRRLGLSNNHLDSPVCSRLAEGLKTIPQIEEIDLSCNKIQDAGMKEIAMVLPGMKNVKLIKLSGNRIGNKTLEKLAPILPFKKHLKVLHLSSCQLDSEGLGHLVGILAKCPQIEEISLSENNIGDKGVMSLMTPWPPSSQLRKIDLSWNKLGDETAKELAMVLPGMIRMKILDLDNNCITTYGASMLARQLPRCPGIQTIRLWHNPILKDVKQKLADQEPRLHFA